MITATDEFRAAILAGKPAQLKLDFGSNNVLEGDGIARATFTEAAVTEDELTIGGCPAASLDFDVVNENGNLDDWTWGRFEAWAGVDVSGSVEYIRLGVFYAQQPEKSHARVISVSALDGMAKLDVDASAWWNALTWPKTIGEIYAAFCTQFEITTTTSTFINSTVSIPAQPAELTATTAREILRWIAEAAASFARFDREGKLELVWFATADAEIGDGATFEREIAEYEVPVITGVMAQGVEDDVGVTVGTAGNLYAIMDNPLLYGTSETEIQSKLTPISTRLTAFAAYRPIVARCIGDWSIQAGDVITLAEGETEYSLPIFMQTVEFQARVATYESYGAAEKREAVSMEKRQTLATRRTIHVLKNTVDELSSEITTVENDLDGLSGTVTSQGTLIQQNATNIALKANKTVTDALGNRLTTAEASIVVNADAITSKVSKNGIVSSINQSAEQIKIAANKLTLDGLVTLTGLSGGSTTIDGGCIKTGKISADRINVPNIDASKITSGTISTDRLAASVVTTDRLTAGSIEVKSGSGSNWTDIKAGGINCYTATKDVLIANGMVYVGTNNGFTGTHGGQIEAYHVASGRLQGDGISIKSTAQTNGVVEIDGGIVILKSNVAASAAYGNTYPLYVDSDGKVFKGSASSGGGGGGGYNGPVWADYGSTMLVMQFSGGLLQSVEYQ